MHVGGLSLILFLVRESAVKMANKSVQSQQQFFRYKNFVIDKDQLLGHGSYGAVYKAMCDQLPCAAKVLHQTILDPKNKGSAKIVQQFQQECTFMENIRYPHIVQYLGMTMDPEYGLPVLLMELLDESLTEMLERSQQSLAYCVQVDICHDIALAVAYLHSNDIIHRDLSSNNVLIIAGRRAKVTDFGMSKIAGTALTKAPLTMCPGTLGYMPPEALREPPRYTKKLDCFSEGVIMIQVCTRLLPEPGPRSQLIKDARSPTGSIEIPVLEPDRRKEHIDSIDPTHPLLPIAVECLEYTESERPSSEEICQMLNELKRSRDYQESLQRVDKFQNERSSSNQEEKLKAKDKNNMQTIQQQQEEIRAKNIQLQEKDKLFQKKESQFQRELASRERQIQQINHQLEKQQKVIEELQQSNHSLQQQLKGSIHQQEQQKVMTDLQQSNHSLQQQAKQLKDHLDQKESQFQRELAYRERRIQQVNHQLEEQQKIMAELQQSNHSLQQQLQDSLHQQKQRTGRASKRQPMLPPVKRPAQTTQIVNQGQDNEGTYSLIRSEPDDVPPPPLFPRQKLCPPAEDTYESMDDLGAPPLPPKYQPCPESRLKLLPPGPKSIWTNDKIKLEWRDGGKAPIIMERGGAVSNGNTVYFVSTDGESCSYNMITGKWNDLSKCPHGYSCVAIIYNHLTAIGGCTFDNFEPQNKLVSQIGDRGWVEYFPPMPTKRWKTAAVYTEQYLVVAGGKNESTSQLSTVEVMDIRNVEWSIVASLPHPYSEASTAICGDNIYMLGGFDNAGKTKSVLTCSLTELLQSHNGSARVWNRIADVPTTRSTCAAVDGHLLAVGGMDMQNKRASTIFEYSTSTGSWELVSNMPTPQYNRLVAVLPTNEMIVVGGCTRFKTDTVDIAKARLT